MTNTIRALVGALFLAFLTVSSVFAQEVPYSDAEIAELGQISQTFHDELTQEGLALNLVGASDCNPSDWLINDQPVKNGPYGWSFAVAPGENNLVASYSKSWCRDQVSVRTWIIHPGDVLFRTGPRSINSLSAREICGLLRDQRPQWQPEKDVSLRIEQRCGISQRSDQRPEAALARIGTYNQWIWTYGTMPSGFRPYYTDNHDKLTATMPAHSWSTEVDADVLENGTIIRPHTVQMMGGRMLLVPEGDLGRPLNWRAVKIYRFTYDELGRPALQWTIWP